MFKSIYAYLFILLSLVFFNCSEDSTTTPADVVPTFEKPEQVITKIKRGINIGNTMEAPTEGEWYNGLIQEYYFDDYKNAGFNCIRIPIRWDEHTSDVSPYNVNPAWLDRVEQVVNWGLTRDLYLIINAHHEWWLVDNYTDPNIRERFISIWRQVSERFKDKSGKLLFEIINEPHGLTEDENNEVNQNILLIIRETNPKRIVIFGGNEWSGSDQLLSAAIPNDEYLMGYYHSYDPWDFAGESNGTWGTYDDINAIKSKFAKVVNWSSANNIPVIISEFGAVRSCDYNSRMLHYYIYVEQALIYNIAFQVWDDGGDFGIYERSSRSWPEVKDILIHTYPEGPAMLQGGVANTNIYLTWSNRSTEYEQIIVQRKTSSTDFEEIAQLDSNTEQFHEVYTGLGELFYRVIAKFTNRDDMYSNPVKIILP